jgi:hypothetical protein
MRSSSRLNSLRALLGAAALALQPEAIPSRLPPVELCASEAGFEAFRSRLNDVIARKDERALLAMLSDEVEVNFGGDRGPALFAANWKFDEPDDSHVWAELEGALRLGCSPTGDALIAPSFVPRFPDQLDAFETVIVRPGTQLRAAPSDTAKGLGRLDWHLAKVTGDVVAAWLGVELLDGRRGFVRREQTVNPLGYRAVFENLRGEWRITAFVAGD